VARGELAGECLTGEPARPAEESGRLKLCEYGMAVCWDEPKGLWRPKELPLWKGWGMCWLLLAGLEWWAFIGLEW
jgi:hypothetical protein